MGVASCWSLGWSSLYLRVRNFRPPCGERALLVSFCCGYIRVFFDLRFLAFTALSQASPLIKPKAGSELLVAPPPWRVEVVWVCASVCERSDFFSQAVRPSQSHVNRGQILPCIEPPDMPGASSGDPVVANQAPAPKTPVVIPGKTPAVSFSE